MKSSQIGIALLLLGLSAIVAVIPCAEAVQFNATLIGDTTIRNNGATINQNFGAEQTTEALPTAADFYMPWFMFNITPFQNASSAVRASICLNTFGVVNTSITGFQFRNSTNQTWLSGNCNGYNGYCGGGIKWATQPAYDNTTQTTYGQRNFTTKPSETYYCFDVSSQINQYITHGYGNATLVMFPMLNASWPNGFNFRTQNSTATPFMNVSTGGCYAPYGTPPDFQGQYYKGGGIPGIWDLTRQGYCSDDWGNISDSCFDYSSVSKQTCGAADYCIEYNQACNASQTCSNGKCVSGITWNFTSNRDGCAVYSLNYTIPQGLTYSVHPLNGQNFFYPLNTSVVWWYYPTSDCTFDFWYISNSSNKWKEYSNYVNLTEFDSMNVTAVWVGGTPVGGGTFQTGNGGGVNTGNEAANAFTSGWFILFGIIAAVSTVAAIKTRNAKMGLMVGALIFIGCLFAGYLPNWMFIPVIAFFAMIVVQFILKVGG